LGENLSISYHVYIMLMIRFIVVCPPYRFAVKLLRDYTVEPCVLSLALGWAQYWI